MKAALKCPGKSSLALPLDSFFSPLQSKATFIPYISDLARSQVKTSIIFFLSVLSVLYVLFSLSCLTRLRYFSPEVVVRCLPKWPAGKVAMVVFVRKLKVVHKQVGDCLISYNLLIAIFWSRNWNETFFATKFSETLKKWQSLETEKFRNRNVNLWGPLSWTKYTPNQNKKRPEKPIRATGKYFFRFNSGEEVFLSLGVLCQIKDLVFFLQNRIIMHQHFLPLGSMCSWF